MAKHDSREEKPKHQWQLLKESWYGKLNVTVRQLDIVIGVCLVLLVVVLVHGFVNRGYTVTFDSNGGTDVASQSLMYGDLVEDSGQPTREGYEFGGWYLDEGLTQPWDLETDTVSESMTLYASWIPIDQ